MAGIVGVIANDSARYSLFSSCIDQLHLPDGWRKEWVIGGDWCDARNQLCQMVLDEGYSHLWFMDDDHAFPPEILTRLLAHDVPLVTPVCLTRVYPFNPVQYVAGDDGGKTLPLPLSQQATDGLVEIAAGGCAGMLIRADVIRATEKQYAEDIDRDGTSHRKAKVPWFEYSDQSEDVLFCGKAKAAGFKLYTDLSVRLGHITTAVVWPAVKDGVWTTGLNIGRDLALTVDTFEGFLEKQEEESQKEPWWIWKLTPELNPEKVIYKAVLAPWNQMAWEPPYDAVPKGVLQGWVDEQDGNGFHPVGDPYTYTLEETK
jgi:hypothetical protein